MTDETESATDDTGSPTESAIDDTESVSSPADAIETRDGIDDAVGAITDATEIDDERVAALLSAFGLKSETRTGWTNAGIDDAESVAAHSWGVALLAFTLADEWETVTGASLDRARVVELAIVHDLGEAVVGDVPATADQAIRERAERGEQAAIEAFGAALDAPLADRYREFEAGETAEARFVRDLDKLEMLTQAVRYEHDGPSLATFFETAGERIGSDPGRAWFDRLVAARETVESSDETTDTRGVTDDADEAPDGVG